MNETSLLRVNRNPGIIKKQKAKSPRLVGIKMTKKCNKIIIGW